jgi:hypothetical protein
MMGNEATITATTFPKQGELVGRRTRVIFHYSGPELLGTIVRNDWEEPYRTIIKLLDDGRYIMASECQHSPELP